MSKQTEKVLSALTMRTASCELASLSDRELLGQFAQSGDQGAFSVVVKRHGGMVLGVCRRVLRSQDDAEDAFQAVFLVLARKAKATRWQASVANWLYVTARKVAQNARLAASRRAKREGVAARGSAAASEAALPLDSMTARELVAVLEEELGRLPARYREPLVLCHLEGLTRDEAAARLGIPCATLKSRLERGRRRLADALATRGCVPGVAVLLAAVSSAGAIPPRLVKCITAAVSGSPSEAVAALAKGVGVESILTPTKSVVLMVVVAVTGFGYLSAQIPGGPSKFAIVTPDEPPAKRESARPDGSKQTITGRVIGEDGKPLVADLSLVWQRGKSQPLGKTAADGTFNVSVPVGREYGGWLVATAPGCGPDFRLHGPGHLPPPGAATAQVTLTLPKERPIKGRVLDQQGKPVVGAAVSAVSLAAYDRDASAGASLEFAEAPDGGAAAGPDSPYVATTDKLGRFEIPGVGAGQKIRLSVRGTGVADDAVVTVNRDGFDPAPVNQARNDFLKRFAVSGGDRTVWYGPDPTVVLEPEQVVRGRVTDPDGKPRAGVPVSFTRPNKNEVNARALNAVTDRDGRYEIRGARKHRGYMVEVPPDSATGLLPCQGFAADAAGYEPITIDLKCARGVVVSGTVKDKATGLPVPSRMTAFVLPDNSFVEKYPPFLHAASAASDQYRTDPDGRFRVVIVPGPVVLVAVPLNGEMEKYKPVVPDQKHANRFTTDGSPDGGPGFSAYGGRFVPLQGHWCRVIEAKVADTEITADVELEPAAKTLVKVVDADGKPVPGIHATGVKIRDSVRPTEYPDTDTLTIYNLEVKKDRLLTVVHKERKLVGTLLLTAGDKNPVVRLGPGGRVTGRAVDADGKPLAGLRVRAEFARPGVTAAFDALKDTEPVTTGANGEFAIDGLFPGQEFRLTASKGLKWFGPAAAGTPGHTIARHGEALKLGDWKLEPTDRGN